ncbi:MULTISPECIES: MarR family winged helix-turn-helix transcriptional regulator [Oenococcus]|uniref:Transcription regulator n=1 Tax=Oenococcus kitaharae DSM 17330 TaxID=1045004 RepID=G9WF35_9LACO|nr:MarR family transcriptional regulator [Oenococcus kitaharae]EHN58595.1 transcription regulator [Oenococcus kitaharae DSM 17330]OEY84701.1 MarR family transcriptional regulator [Oenococcus kitaharae]OEY84985.1 MarR family transcriptional regulator [Oenococcus kitaharae]OEY85775.1 MarR family transcriptional regulator [Oenococcus kitaharae]
MANKIKAELAAGKLAEYDQLSKIYDDVIKQARPRLTVQGQGKILLALADEDHLSQRELATRLGISPQSTSEFVNKLVKYHLVTLTKSPNDRRINLVNLTSEGRKQIESAAQEVPPFIKTLSDTELDQLSSLLSKITTAMYADIDAANSTLGVKLHKLFASRYLKQFKP